jgi:hypothetical protein
MDAIKKLLESSGQWSDQIETGLTLVKWGVVAVAALVAVVAVFALLYLVRMMGDLLKPLAATVRWLVGLRPGRKPGPVLAGVNLGVWMSVWALLLSAGLYFVIR